MFLVVFDNLHHYMIISCCSLTIHLQSMNLLSRLQLHTHRICTKVESFFFPKRILRKNISGESTNKYIPATLERPERHRLEVFQFHFQPNEGHKGYEGHQSLLIVSFQFDSLQCPRCAVESMAEQLWAPLLTNYYLRPNPRRKVNRKIKQVAQIFLFFIFMELQT